jgi:hypothetical protein
VKWYKKLYALKQQIIGKVVDKQETHNHIQIYNFKLIAASFNLFYDQNYILSIPVSFSTKEN